MFENLTDIPRSNFNFTSKIGKVCIVAFALSYGCASTDEQQSDNSLGKLEKSGSSNEKFSTNESSGKKMYFGTTFVNSSSNNPMSFKDVDRSKAGDVSRSIKGKKPKDLVAKIAGVRLSGQGSSVVLEHIKEISDIELKKGVEKSGNLDERAQLELALAGVQEKNLGMFFLIFDSLRSSKNRKIKAGIYNGLGVVNIHQNRLPEAVIAFREALKADENYYPAHLNLGFLYLTYGNFERANYHLGRNPSDSTAKVGLLVSNRFMGQADRSESICNQVLKKYSNHKPTLFNCGVYYLQEKKDIKKAKELISRALKISGGPPSWDDRGYKVLESLN